MLTPNSKITRAVSKRSSGGLESFRVTTFYLPQRGGGPAFFLTSTRHSAADDVEWKS